MHTFLKMRFIYACDCYLCREKHRLNQTVLTVDFFLPFSNPIYSKENIEQVQYDRVNEFQMGPINTSADADYATVNDNPVSNHKDVDANGICMATGNNTIMNPLEVPQKVMRPVLLLPLLSTHQTEILQQTIMITLETLLCFTMTHPITSPVLSMKLW